MKHYNTNNLVPIGGYARDIMKEIEEADWIGKPEDADNLREELDTVHQMQTNGATWYPLF
jgi:hypothetical protein